MSDPFLGQIMMVGFNFAPRGWATCDGQILAISQNSALFALLGTTFGGNGTVTFGLPDLRGRVPIHHGQGPSLTPCVMGESGGVENVQLYANQMPAHNHQLIGTTDAANSASPAGGFPAAVNYGGDPVQAYKTTGATTTLNGNAIGIAGQNQAHLNMQPYLVINFVIALAGIFPSRN